MKIRQNDGDEADDDDDNEEEEEEAEDDAERPDSGFSSRADTPRSLSGSPTKDDVSELNEDMENENKKFLAELDEGLSSEDEEEESDWDGDSDDGFKKVAKKQAKPTKKQKKMKAALNVPFELPGAMKSELSEYEKLCQDNIKERQDMLAALMADFADFKKYSEIGVETGHGARQKRRGRKRYSRRTEEVFKTVTETR